MSVELPADPWSWGLSFFVVVVVPAVAWVIRRGLYSRAEGEALRQRVVALEASQRGLATHDEMHELSAIVGNLAGRIELIGARSDDRHQEFHTAVGALERKLDQAVVQILTPLQVLIETGLERPDPRTIHAKAMAPEEAP